MKFKTQYGSLAVATVRICNEEIHGKTLNLVAIISLHRVLEAPSKWWNNRKLIINETT